MRIVLVTVSLWLCACGPAPPGGAGTNATAIATSSDLDEAGVKAEVGALLDEWTRAGAEGNWEGLKALYADDPDFVWIEDGRIAYEDHAAVIAGVDQAAAMNPKLSTTLSEVVVTPLAPDAAVFRTLAQVRFEAEAFSFDFSGAFSGVAVKRNGRWLFLQGHLSRPEAAPAP